MLLAVGPARHFHSEARVFPVGEGHQNPDRTKSVATGSPFPALAMTIFADDYVGSGWRVFTRAAEQQHAARWIQLRTGDIGNSIVRQTVSVYAAIGLHRHRAVLVNEAAEHVVATDFVSRESGADPVAGDRYLKLDSSMRALPVVVAGILAKDSLEVAVANDEQPIEAFGANRSYPAFRVGVRPWRSDRCLDHADSLGAEHLLEGAVNLVSRFRMRNLMERPRSERSPTRLRATWVTNAPVGCSVTPRMCTSRVDSSINEKHVELLERHGVYGEEIRGQHAVRLGSQELPPRGSAPRNGTQTVAAQDPSDRAGRDPDAELAQFALDARMHPQRRFS
jgi:hypothetical protein